MASAFLVEQELADALVLLDQNADRGELMDAAALALCERAAVDPRDRAAVQDLVHALATRLSDMSGGRQHAFEDALAAFPSAERFGLPALATVLWPTLENLYAAGERDPAAYQRALAQHRPALRLLYERSSGRSAQAFEHTWAALHDRLPRAFLRHADWMDTSSPSPVARLLMTPEGTAVLTGALGLLTIRMAVPTPLVCGVLALVGYLGVAPLAERLRNAAQRLVMDALRAEDAVLVRDVPFADLGLMAVLNALRPVLHSALLAGFPPGPALREQASPLLRAFRAACTQPGGPGAPYADAVEDVVFTKYAPRLGQLVETQRAQVGRGAWARLWSDPNGAGVLTALLTLPLSWLAARSTPLPLLVDLPLMVAGFYGAGRTLSWILASTRRAESQLEAAMEAEGRLLSGLYSTSVPSQSHIP